MKELYNFYDIHNNHYPIISEELYSIVNQNEQYLDNLIIHDRDYLLDYFGFKTLERAYLFRKNNIPIERPQHMCLRVASPWA